MLKSIDNLSIGGAQEKIVQDEIVQQLEDKNVVDGIHATELPPSSIDSRKLLDNVIVTKLTLDQQDLLYSELSSMIQGSLFDTEKQTNDEKVKRYNEGVNCALTNIIYDLKCKEDLYYLCSKYDRIVKALIILYEETKDEPEVNYIQTVMRGRLAAYINFLDVLRDKLNKEENLIFRQGDIPVVR